MFPHPTAGESVGVCGREKNGKGRNEGREDREILVTRGAYLVEPSKKGTNEYP